MLDDAQAVALPPYDVQAIVVLTDGIENVAPMIAAVAPGITAPTYAVGLGLPGGISTASLNALAQGTGKYLLVTGALTDDQRFRLSKFFLQILAGINNANLVLDPTGHLVCYQVQGKPRHQRRSNVHTADQFGVEQLDTIREREICIPSERG